MVNIAICDDDKLFLEKLSDLITNEAKLKQYRIKIYKTDIWINIQKNDIVGIENIQYILIHV